MPEPLAQERPDRVVGRSARGCRARPASRRAGGSGPARNGCGSARGSPSGASRRRARPGRSSRPDRRPVEVARVERLQRVAHDDPSAPPLGAGRWRRHVEQLADRHGRRPALVGALVAAGVGDDQAVGGGQQRVEQQLAVLAARRRCSPTRGSQQQDVVAVAERRGAGTRRRRGPCRQITRCGHRAHRHQRADGEVAGAEVGPGRAAGEPVGQQRRGPRRATAGRRRRRPRLGDDVVEQALELAALPRRRARSSAQSASAAPAMAVAQPADGLGVGERVDARRRAGSTNSAKRPARSIAPLSTSSSGSAPPNRRPVLLGHRDPQQQPVEARRPTCPPATRLEPVGRAMLRVEAPADPRLRRPTRRSGPRSSSSRRNRRRTGGAVGEVEHLRRRSAARRRGRAARPPRRGPGWSGAASGRPGGRAAARPPSGRRRTTRRRRTSRGSAARTSRCRGT